MDQTKPTQSHDAPSDEGLIALIAQGDEAALAALYDAYSGLLMGLGVKFLRDPGVAEDITHDLFVEIWRTASDFDPSRASARTWIMMKARCRLIDRVRRIKRRRTLLADSPERVMPEDFATPAPTHMEHREVREAIDRMPDTLKQVLVLMYFEHHTSREVADKLDLPVGTVKSRVATAKRALRDLLVDGGRPPSGGGAS